MGLGLQSAFGGAALDQALQDIVAQRRLKELQDQQQARLDAELKIKQDQSKTAQEEATQAGASRQFQAMQGQPAEVLGPQTPDPVTHLTRLPGVQPMPEMSIPGVGGASPIKLRPISAQQQADAKFTDEVMKPTVLGKDQVLTSGGQTIASGPAATPEYKDEFLTIGGKQVPVKTDTKTGNRFNPDTGEPIKAEGTGPAQPQRDPLLEALTAAQLKALNDKSKVDPEAVAFWGRQVLQDPANMGLVKNQAMQTAVTGWIADNGGDVNRLTSAGKQMQELAKVVAPHIDTVQNEADQLDKMGLLGPIGSRWRDFVAKKIGAGEFAGGNEKNAELIGKFQTDVGLLITAVARVHGGARAGGSPTMIKHLEGLLDSGAADLGEFKGQLASFKDFMSTYAGMGNPNGGVGGAADFRFDPTTGTLVPVKKGPG